MLVVSVRFFVSVSCGFLKFQESKSRLKNIPSPKQKSQLLVLTHSQNCQRCREGQIENTGDPVLTGTKGYILR